ncbi:MAG: hypothetical protein P4L79_17915 [Legionella sp.]|uniref:hypothetical protein n=1 Tax=Legionella sp. TaxID=459 RepID=UPI0028456E86|nr:hypothetical protein [Legionella sp.]
MPSKTLSQLMSDLSTLNDKYQADFEPEYSNAKAILKSMGTALKDSSDVFKKVADLYSQYVVFQTKVQGQSNEEPKRCLAITHFNQQIFSELPTIDKTIKTVERKLKKMICDLNKSIEILRPLVDEFNTCLSQINDQRPKGFFKSNEAVQLKKTLKGFQEEYPGKKGLLWLWDQQNEIIAGFKKVQEMRMKIHKSSIGLHGFVEKKVNSSTFFKAQGSVPHSPEAHPYDDSLFEIAPEAEERIYEYESKVINTLGVNNC